MTAETPRKTTFRFVFYHNINVKENVFFFRARVEKGIAWHIDASSVVETLIYHGKLANQIARLRAIVVKLLIRKHHDEKKVNNVLVFIIKILIIYMQK